MNKQWILVIFVSTLILAIVVILQISRARRLKRMNERANETSSFRILSEFHGTVTNDAGVIINIAAHHGYITYEVDGICYFIHKESGYDGINYIDCVGPSLPLVRLGNTMNLVKPKTLPKGLVEQMKRDIPLAYAAHGRECVLV